MRFGIAGYLHLTLVLPLALTLALIRDGTDVSEKLSAGRWCLDYLGTFLKSFFFPYHLSYSPTSFHSD